MKFTVADLLDQLHTSEGREVARLEKAFKFTSKADQHTLEMALTALQRLGILNVNAESGLLTRQQNDGLIEACLRCSSKGFCFAIREDGGEDIYIRDHQLNHAWNGDRVLVRITWEGSGRRSPEGSIQCILERTTTSLLALVKQQGSHLIASPLDDRLLAAIHLSSFDIGCLADGEIEHLAEIAIDCFPIGQYPAKGHVVRMLPIDGGIEADRELLLTKVHLQNRSATPRSTLRTPPTKRRQDLTCQPALLLRSWLSQGAPTLPAIHALPHSGGIRLWLHAPAVAERINPGNSLDLWLRERAESLCLGQVWQPMFNSPLSKACEFRVGETQDAVSICMDIGAGGRIHDWSFQLSKICPVSTVDSSALKALASRKPRSRTIPAALRSLKDQLGQIESLISAARLLHVAEQQSGSIELDLPIPSLKDLGDLTAVEPDRSMDSWFEPLNESEPQSILSRFIRAADRCWTEQMSSLHLPGLSLDNCMPDPCQLNDVAKAAIALELPLHLDEENISPSVAELAAVFAESPVRRVLDLQLCQSLPGLTLQIYGQGRECLEGPKDIAVDAAQEGSDEIPQAKPKEWPRTPWCCPTLHYADLVNQQVIATLLNDGKDRPTVRHKNRVNLGEKGVSEQVSWPLFSASQAQKLHALLQERLVQRLNLRRRQARELRNDLVAMFQARAAEPLIGQRLTGVISGVQSYGFFVEVPPFMVEGLVHVSALSDDWYEYRSRQNRLVGRKNRRIYKLGDNVTVIITKVDSLRNQIDMEIVVDEACKSDGEEADIRKPLPVAVSEEV